MATYQELVARAQSRKEEEEEQSQDLFPFSPYSSQPVVDTTVSPEEEYSRSQALTVLNNYKQDSANNKFFNREDDDTFVSKTPRIQNNRSVESITTEFSLDDLEDPNHFLHNEWRQRTNRFLEGLGKLQQDSSVRKTKDIFEYLRDEKWSTTRTITRAMQNKHWTPEMMEDYRFLRQVFDKAKLGGTRQIVEAAKDISIDLLADPLNIVTGVVSMFTAGAGGAAVQAGARGVAAMAGKQALAQATRTKTKQLAVSPTWDNILRGMSIGATEGGIDGALINAGTQISEKQTGLRHSDFSWGELATASGAGAILGVTLGGSVAAVGNAMARRAHSKAMGQSDISFPEQVLDAETKELRPTRGEDIQRFRQASYTTNKFISATLGKATTRYVHIAEAASPKLKNLIQQIRYDAFKGILPTSMVDEVVKPSYNIRREMREGKLRVLADKFLSKTIFKGQGMLGRHSFYNIKMDPLSNDQLLGLLSGDHKFDLTALYKRYYNIKSKDTMDGTLKANANKLGKIKLYGENVAPEVVGAAFHVRRALDNAHQQGSRIDIVGTDGKISGQASLFSFGKRKIKNYIPHIWKYDELEAQRSKVADLLVETKHTDLLEGQFPRARGTIVDNNVELEIINGKVQKKIKGGELTDLTPDELASITITSSYDTNTNKWVRTKNEELEFILSQQKDYDQAAFKNLFDKEGVSSFRDLAKKKSPDATPEEIEIIARRLKAEALVDNILNAKYDLEISPRDITSDRTSFANERAFSELRTRDLADLGVIETDVSQVFHDYMHKVATSIERTALFGNTKADFAQRWQIPIQQELMEARKNNPNLTLDIIREITGGPAGTGDDSGIMKLYSRVTGLDSSYIKSKTAAVALDTTKVGFRLSMLPLAVVSSITEPMIALSRADLADTPAYIKEFAGAAAKQFSKGFKRALRVGQVVRGKEVRGMADLSDEEWMDFYEAGLSAEYAMEERLKGLYGEYHTRPGRWISQQFFKYNLLIPWTEAVQMGAYNFSNARITRMLGDLDRGSNVMGQRLSEKAILRRSRELREIGITPKEGLEAYRANKAASPTGKFDRAAWTQSDYYDHSVTPASSLFAREIILNPSVAEANTPLWFQNPATQLLVQFMGYPTAFNNIVLKGMLRNVIRDPLVNGPKALAATTLMTGTAMLGNALRSHGDSLDEPFETQVAEGFRRWGGMGPVDHWWRWQQAQQYGGTGLAPVIKAGTGPLPGVVLDMLQYRQTLGEAGISFIPGWAALSPDQRKSIRQASRRRTPKGSWQDILMIKRPIQKDMSSGFATGGLVDIDNAIAEPDERIDRMTGLPYNIQAGAAFQDEEDRIGFATGDLVEKNEEIRGLSDKEIARANVKKNDMYRLLTQHEEEYATLDQTPLVIHSQEELNDLDIKDTFYTSLPNNSRKSKLDAFRDSSTLGLKVSESPMQGNVKLGGRIHFKNLLTLNIDEVTPAAIQERLPLIKSSNVKADPLLVDSIIDSMLYNLGVRDTVLEADDELTKDKEDVIEQSKSFILRHGLLRLGFDAIKYNNGYVLLRENQFMPTEIMGRDARNQGGLMGSLKKQRARYNEGREVEDTSTTDTGKQTRVGRTIWVDPNRYEGQEFSERTNTFPINQEQTKWVTFPSIDEQGQEISEANLRQYVINNGPVDPITGEEFPVFSNMKEAVKYAEERSPSLRTNKKEGGLLSALKKKNNDKR